MTPNYDYARQLVTATGVALELTDGPQFHIANSLGINTDLQKRFQVLKDSNFK